MTSRTTGSVVAAGLAGAGMLLGYIVFVLGKPLLEERVLSRLVLAEDPLARGGEATLGHGILVQLALEGLGGQQLLVDHLIQALAEQIAGDVQRLALADQTLRNGLTLDVRGPDIVAVDLGHSHVARLGGLFGTLVLAAGGQNKRGDHDDPGAD